MRRGKRRGDVHVALNRNTTAKPTFAIGVNVPIAPWTSGQGRKSQCTKRKTLLTFVTPDASPDPTCFEVIDLYRQMLQRKARVKIPNGRLGTPF
jgi:hypothetical protein